MSEFVAMLERAYLDRLAIPADREGRLWLYRYDGATRRGHRHREPRVGLSAPRLSRLFKAQVGVPLARFRTQVRVRTFLDRLAGGHVRSLLDTAYDCGFGSYAQFFRAVKAETGRTPAQLTGRPGGR